MSIASELKKEGIEVTQTLDTLKVNSIAKNIAQKLVAAFPEHDFKLGELFIRLSRLHMYLAKVPANHSEANYCYKNASIYFNEKIDMQKIDSYAMHECIHSLQERKDKNGKLERMGLCNYSSFKVNGLALNEAAVQLATSKALGNFKDNVKYYGISFDTISSSCYPLECNLIEQMAYITGEYTLFDSTFNSNDSFKNKFIELTSHETYDTVEKNLDKILSLESKLVKWNNKLMEEDSSRQANEITKKISKQKDTIKKLFVDTQNLIMTSYFDTALTHITNLEELENYRRKLYNYKNIIGIIENYSFFNNYYISVMAKLEKLYYQLENGEEPTLALAVVKQNKFIKLILAIKKFLSEKEEKSII